MSTARLPSRILVAMMPCLRLYADLDQRLAPTVAPDGSCVEWVTTYGHDPFGALARRIEALLDAHDAGSVAIADHYRRAMRPGPDFFEQAATTTS